MWQGRFFSCALDRDHLVTALAYVDLNPVRAGIVGDALEYPWSSARAPVEGRDAGGLLDLELWRQMPGHERCAEVFGRPLSEKSCWANPASKSRKQTQPLTEPREKQAVRARVRPMALQGRLTRSHGNENHLSRLLCGLRGVMGAGTACFSRAAQLGVGRTGRGDLGSLVRGPSCRGCDSRSGDL